MKGNKVGFTSQCHPESQPLPLGCALKSSCSGSYQTMDSGFRCLSNQSGEMPNQVGSDSLKAQTLNKSDFRAPLRSGFTLIELLVVVLIIGILSAVAVPQYQKAVSKSRVMAAVNVLKTIKDAQEIYYMEHGEYARDFSVLDMQLPGGAVDSTSTMVTYPDSERYYMFVHAQDGTQSIKVNPKGLKYAIDLEWYLDHHTFWADDLPGSFVLCSGRTEQGKKICKSLGGVYHSTNSNGVAENYVIPHF